MKASSHLDISFESNKEYAPKGIRKGCNRNSVVEMFLEVQFSAKEIHFNTLNYKKYIIDFKSIHRYLDFGRFVNLNIWEAGASQASLFASPLVNILSGFYSQSNR